MSWVSLEAAIGTITLQEIPLRLPSIASVLESPINPLFAALKPEKTTGYWFSISILISQKYGNHLHLLSRKMDNREARNGNIHRLSIVFLLLVQN